MRARSTPCPHFCVCVYLTDRLCYSFSSDEPLSELLRLRRAERNIEPKSAGVEVPPHIFHRYIEFFDTGEEFVVVGFALATADDFAGLRIVRIIALPDLKQLF